MELMGWVNTDPWYAGAHLARPLSRRRSRFPDRRSPHPWRFSDGIIPSRQHADLTFADQTFAGRHLIIKALGIARKGL